MIEVTKGLFVGSQEDYELHVKEQEGWKIVHACKEPYHRQALGYKGRSASKDHPEYLMAVRENRLILNLVDADDPAFIRKEIINRALEFIYESLSSGKKVLLHCNQGISRSAGIALLYMAKHGLIPNQSYERAKQAFESIYSLYRPAHGMQEFLRINWLDYCHPQGKNLTRNRCTL